MLNPNNLVTSVTGLIEQLILAHDRHNALTLPLMLREIGINTEFISDISEKYPDLTKPLRITEPDTAERIITAIAVCENITITSEQIKTGLANFGIRRAPPPIIPPRDVTRNRL